MTYERLLNALKEPQNWLTYWGDYTGIRHRDLKQIQTGNVKDLRAAWVFQTGVPSCDLSVGSILVGVPGRKIA